MQDPFNTVRPLFCLTGRVGGLIDGDDAVQIQNNKRSNDRREGTHYGPGPPNAINVEEIAVRFSFFTSRILRDVFSSPAFRLRM